MRTSKLLQVAVAVSALALGVYQGQAQNGKGVDKGPKPKKITQEDRKAAAKRVKEKLKKIKKPGQGPGGIGPGGTGTGGMGTVGIAAIWPGAVKPEQGGLPDYFGPYSNWANSPLPKGSIDTITVTNGGSGYTSATVSIADAYNTGSGATATASIVGGVIQAIAVTNPGVNYTAPAVIIEGDGVDATAVAALKGLTGGVRKFVDTLPGLNAVGRNNLGQYIPVGIPDTTTYPGSDYYEIELGEFTEKMHSDLPPTTLRGYRQTNTTDATVSVFRSLGPLIIARKDRPVRIKFTNRLPVGAGGRLFLPVDTTIMGSGPGPSSGWNGSQRGDTICTGAAGTPTPLGCYTENRATLHLHGGASPWISDGTPHQWIAPAAENTSYKRGASTQNVPDMPDPGDGSETFYYTNQQSSRLMFYHDHSYGITRLNVYAGEAAGYIIRDEVEDALVKGGTVMGRTYAAGTIPADEIPLIIQDKTFVDAATILATDPTWNWGTGTVDPTTGKRAPKTGDLWWPHVYMTAQNPYDLAGINPMGRWHYGPWFWPPTTGIPWGPVPNPLYGPDRPEQPPENPGTPNVSWGAEAFLDTPVVNGAAYPTLTVAPKAYRFRILNASHDRFWNLQLYRATGALQTEVKMVPASPGTGLPANWPVDGREGGVPDPLTAGPNFIQIATEGFLPKPVVVQNRPIAWNLDPTTFNFGNVSDHALLLGPAERADVIIDFSQYAGQTLILYNDAPAAFPALDPRLDYYTGKPDQSLAGEATGGTPTTYEGYGPNTRTVMKIQVSAGAAVPFDLNRLNAAFASDIQSPGVFEAGQDPIIVAQSPYNSAYNKSFPTAWPLWGYARIQDNSMQVQTVAGANLTLPLQPKAIQDEMGEAFDDFGRMSAKLGLELPFTQAGNQNFVLQNFVDPATEVINDSVEPGPPVAGDGTQIWKITHNGVDTHPVHFHLFDVQLLNRVGWDGAIRPPDPNELGWKDTIRVNPLEDTIVALRPVAPRQPFGIPDSQRLLNPALPLGAASGFTNIDPLTGQPRSPAVTNTLYNFGWEYVWHCHILSHEELDMMRPIVFNVARALPDAPVLSGTRTGGSVALTWTDGTPFVDYSWVNLGPPGKHEIGFRVERASVANGTPGAYSVLASLLPNKVAYTDNTAGTESWAYRVVAFNATGNSPSNAVLMTTGAAPALEVTPASLTFSSSLNVRTANQTVTVRNSGASALTINGIALAGTSAGQFQLVVPASGSPCGTVFPKALAAGASCEVNVNFRPTSTMTPRTATLNVTVASPATSQSVALTGNVVTPVFTLTPASMSFSAAVNALSAPQAATITNTGTVPLAISSIARVGTNPGQFAHTHTCGVLPATLNPGASCTATVTFRPTSAGTKTAQLRVAVTGATAQTVNLTGSTTAASPVLTTTPTAINFGNQRVGTNRSQDLIVSNTGTAPLALTGAVLGGTNAGQFSMFAGVVFSGCTVNGAWRTLQPSATCRIRVTFRPGSTGAKSATLTVNAAAPVTPKVVPLSGTGI